MTTFRERFVVNRRRAEMRGYKVLRLEISLHDLEEIVMELRGMRRFAQPVRRDIDVVDGEYDGLPFREIGDGDSRLVTDQQGVSFAF